MSMGSPAEAMCVVGGGRTGTSGNPVFLDVNLPYCLQLESKESEEQGLCRSDDTAQGLYDQAGSLNRFVITGD